jgi:hypothetical protein
MSFGILMSVVFDYREKFGMEMETKKKSLKENLSICSFHTVFPVLPSYSATLLLFFSVV